MNPFRRILIFINHLRFLTISLSSIGQKANLFKQFEWCGKRNIIRPLSLQLRREPGFLALKSNPLSQYRYLLIAKNPVSEKVQTTTQRIRAYQSYKEVNSP
jgi:hypothetical protein